MAITRPSYITRTELNEILNASYADEAATTQLINEASEYLEYISTGRILCVDMTEDNKRVTNIKIGMAYQVQYFDESIDDNDYSSSTGGSLGKFSEGSGKTSALGEGLKLSPKASRYWRLANMLYRGTA